MALQPVLLGWSGCETSSVFKQIQLGPRGLCSHWCFLLYHLHLGKDRVRDGTRRKKHQDETLLAEPNTYFSPLELHWLKNKAQVNLVCLPLKELKVLLIKFCRQPPILSLTRPSGFSERLLQHFIKAVLWASQNVEIMAKADVRLMTASRGFSLLKPMLYTVWVGKK